jgi:hypothetical protein
MYRPQAFRLSFQPPNVVGNGNLSGFLKRFDFLGHSVFLCLMSLIGGFIFLINLGINSLISRAVVVSCSSHICKNWSRSAVL